MQKLDSLEFSLFLNKCPQKDGRTWTSCITKCYAEKKHIKDACKEEKEKYFKTLELLSQGKTRND